MIGVEVAGVEGGSSPEKKPNAMNKIELFGMIELGGASTQIALPVAPQVVGSSVRKRDFLVRGFDGFGHLKFFELARNVSIENHCVFERGDTVEYVEDEGKDIDSLHDDAQDRDNDNSDYNQNGLFTMDLDVKDKRTDGLTKNTVNPRDMNADLSTALPDIILMFFLGSQESGDHFGWHAKSLEGFRKTGHSEMQQRVMD